MHRPFDSFEVGSQCSAEVVLPNMPLRGRTTSKKRIAVNIRVSPQRHVVGRHEVARRLSDTDAIIPWNELKAAEEVSLETGDPN